MSNSLFAGYGDWRHERFRSSVLNIFSLFVKHCGTEIMWDDKNIHHMFLQIYTAVPAVKQTVAVIWFFPMKITV